MGIPALFRNTLLFQLLLLGFIIFGGFSFAEPNEGVAREQLEVFQTTQRNVRTAKMILAEAEKFGWNDLHLLHDCIHELIRFHDEYEETNGRWHPDLSLSKLGESIRSTYNQRPEVLSPEMLIRRMTVTLQLGMHPATTLIEEFIESPTSPEQRRLIFWFLRQHVQNNHSGRGLLPSGGVYVQSNELSRDRGWAEMEFGELGYMQASPAAKAIAMAKMAASWDKDESVRREARQLLEAFNEAAGHMGQISNPFVRQAGEKMWRNMDERSNNIVNGVRHMVASEAPPMRRKSSFQVDCQALMEAAHGLMGTPKKVPPFVEPGHILGTLN